MDPLSSSPNGSIWMSVDRRTFEKNIDTLKGTLERDIRGASGVVPEPRDYTNAEIASDKTNTMFPLHIERKLADDFSWIAAYDAAVGFVTAAGIECSIEPPGPVVRLAANEGVRDCVDDAITKILWELKACGEKGISRQQCAENVLDIVVLLNSNKLFWRLGSKRYKKPHLGQQERGSLSPHLGKLVQQELKQSYRIPTALVHEIDEFQRLVALLERSEDANPVKEMKAIIKQACSMRGKETNIHSRLQKSGIQEAELNVTDVRREVRDMDKIANYWRICQDLAKIGRKETYRAFFDSARVERVRHHLPAFSATFPNRLPRFVHAEIQLLTYYEICEPKICPRVIGASKEACFLCDAFVRAHGEFSVSKAHRQVYNLWTVPERKEYSRESLERIRRALRDADGQVNQELQRARQQRKRFQPFPLQSSINLNDIAVSSPSMSVVSSISEGRVSAQSLRDLTSRLRSSTIRSKQEQTSRNIEGPATQGPLPLQPPSSTSSVSTIKPVEGQHETRESQDGAKSRIVPVDTIEAPGLSLPVTDELLERQPKSLDMERETEAEIAMGRSIRRDTLVLDMTGAFPVIEPADKSPKHKMTKRRDDSPGLQVSADRETNAPAQIRTKGLDMHVYLEEGSPENTGFTAASISVDPMTHSGLDSDLIVDVRAMAAGDEVAIGRANDASDENLKLGLQLGHGEAVILLCSWRKS